MYCEVNFQCWMDNIVSEAEENIYDYIYCSWKAVPVSCTCFKFTAVTPARPELLHKLCLHVEGLAANFSSLFGELRVQGERDYYSGGHKLSDASYSGCSVYQGLVLSKARSWVRWSREVSAEQSSWKAGEKSQLRASGILSHVSSSQSDINFLPPSSLLLYTQTYWNP